LSSSKSINKHASFHNGIEKLNFTVRRLGLRIMATMTSILPNMATSEIETIKKPSNIFMNKASCSIKKPIEEELAEFISDSEFVEKNLESNLITFDRFVIGF